MKATTLEHCYEFGLLHLGSNFHVFNALHLFPHPFLSAFLDALPFCCIYVILSVFVIYPSLISCRHVVRSFCVPLCWCFVRLCARSFVRSFLLCFGMRAPCVRCLCFSLGRYAFPYSFTSFRFYGLCNGCCSDFPSLVIFGFSRSRLGFFCFSLCA